MWINKLEAFFFLILACLCIVGSFGAVLLKNVMHCALLLGCTLFGVAGMFLMLGGDFLFAVQVAVYVGGILILMLFVVMLTHRLYDRTLSQTNDRYGPAGILAAMILLPLCVAISKAEFGEVARADAQETVVKIGKLLLTTYVVPFEVASLLLLGAMVGAILFTKRDPGQED